MKSSLSFTYLALCLSLTAFAEPIEQGTWKGQNQKIKVEGKSVTVNGQKFVFGPEEITRAYPGLAWDVVQCKLDVQSATKTKSGDIVLVKATLTKTSLSDGILCGSARSTEGFDTVQAFSQMVLTKNAEGKVQLKTAEMKEGDKSQAPSWKALQNPAFPEKKSKLKNFRAKEYELADFEPKQRRMPVSEAAEEESPGSAAAE